MKNRFGYFCSTSMLPHFPIKIKKSIAYHKYADTTEMYIYLSTGHSGPNVTLIKCIEHVNAWICHYLCVNLLSLSLKLKL